jgi:hypothetical protein
MYTVQVNLDQTVTEDEVAGAIKAHSVSINADFVIFIETSAIHSVWRFPFFVSGNEYLTKQSALLTIEISYFYLFLKVPVTGVSIPLRFRSLSKHNV